VLMLLEVNQYVTFINLQSKFLNYTQFNSFMFLIPCNVFPADAGIGAHAARGEPVRARADGDEPKRKTN